MKKFAAGLTACASFMTCFAGCLFSAAAKGAGNLFGLTAAQEIAAVPLDERENPCYTVSRGTPL